MRNAGGHQCKVKMNGSEKKKWTTDTYVDISSTKRVTRKFLEVLRCSRLKNGREMYKSSVLHEQSPLLLVRPIVVFSPFSGVTFAA